MAVLLAERMTVVAAEHADGDVVRERARPAQVSAVFSLDNRRMPMPRVSHPRICSVRSSDFPADPGVLPTIAEQRRLGMHIAQIPGLHHNDMWDGATTEQRAAMTRHLEACLAGLR